MTNLDILIAELQINQIDEVIGGSTTTVDGVVMSSGEDDWYTWTTVKGHITLVIYLRDIL